MFDTGSCLWSDAELLEVPADFHYLAKPFKPNGMRPEDQVRLFEGHFDWLEIDALADYPEEVREILSRNPNMTERRIEAVAFEVEKKIELLDRLAR